MFLIGLEIVQGCVQPTGKAFLAPLAFPVLDVFLLAAFAITDKRVDALIGDPKIVTFWIGTGVPLGGDMLLAATPAFALGVRRHICVRPQNCQRDPRLTTWAILWRSWLPFSRTIVFEQLMDFLVPGFERLPMGEQQGNGKQQDDDLFGAQGEKMHRIG